MFSLLVLPSARAADLSEARESFYRGDYDDCIEMTRTEVERGIWNDFWARQLIETYLVVGEYELAVDVFEEVQPKFSTSLPLRLLAVEAYRFAGKPETATRLLDEIPGMVQSARWRYSDRDNMLAIGRYSLMFGEDARDVIAYYDAILKRDPEYVEAHVAVAELALAKADYQEAVAALERAFKLRPEDPNISFLLARAWEPSSSERATNYLQQSLDLNPSHPPSLLFQSQNLIDSEDYDAAESVLSLVHEVNPKQPLAWALKAAIAHLRGNYKAEGEARREALKHWTLNPEVDYLIGKTLSEHYRFTEGVQYQRRSLRMDSDFLPAKFQLAQDLLRTGNEDEGWELVNLVSTRDKYNVVAFNLRTLKDRLEEFATLESDGFRVRMDRREAEIYGGRVLDLLREAKQTLTKKYDVSLERPVTVEIFTQQSDFAIRTFGLPGGAGYLGVCFGPLITANSPASQGEQPANWESVLWHEFCHVVTLEKTKNRMPRWLSEGISVYEELQRDPSWGQSMTPAYKAMILGEDFVPLSELSSAFMNPKSPMHLQFAYFESSLAVKYLIETQGLPLLRQMLVDLGMGVPLRDAFSSRYGDTQRLDADFEEYARRAAESFAEGASFEKPPELETMAMADLQAWLDDHPRDYVAWRALMQLHLSGSDPDTALATAEAFNEQFPGDIEPGGGLESLAMASRKADATDMERQALQAIVAGTSDRLTFMLRLLEVYESDKEWSSVLETAQKVVAVQPLIPRGHEAIVEAAAELERPELAIDALNALQQLSPTDPAGVHFQLADALFATEQFERSRREVLLALEYAPRYQEALQLLLRLNPDGQRGAPREEAEDATVDPSADAEISIGEKSEDDVDELTVAAPEQGSAPEP